MDLIRKQIIGFFAILFLGCLNSQTMAAIIYVNSDASGAQNGNSWNSAYENLKEAISSAQSGDQIWIAEGVYKASTDFQVDEALLINTSNLSLYGGFQGNETSINQRHPGDHPTILSGELEDPGTFNDNSHILLEIVSANNILIDGIHFQDAYTNPDNYQVEHGALVVINSTLNIRSCSFQENIAHINPCIRSEQATINIESCLFSENISQTGIFYQTIVGDSFVQMVNVTISENNINSRVFGFQSGSTLLFYNSIADESSNAKFNEGGGTVITANSLLANEIGAGTMTNVRFFDPKFVNANAGNFSFNASSPAYDQGNNSYITNGRDLNGNNRIQDTSVDIGCIESVNCEQDNDLCTNAILLELDEEALWGSTKCASHTPDEISPCQNNDGNSVWYRFIAPSSGSVRLSTLFKSNYGGVFDLRHSVYIGSCGSLLVQGCRNSPAIGNTDEINTFELLTPGDSYFLKIDGLPGQEGAFTIELETAPPRPVPNVIYVDIDSPGGDGSNWFEAYNNLVDALAVAQAGNAIWIAEGIYQNTSDPQNLFQIPDGVELIGGFDGSETSLDEVQWDENPTILRSTGQPIRGVVRVLEADIGVTIAGLTLEGASINVGLNNNGDAALTLGDGFGTQGVEFNVNVFYCVFKDNFSTTSGAPCINGSLVGSSAVNVNLSNCLFYNNIGDDRLIKVFSDIVNINATNCTFAGNQLDLQGTMIGGSPSSNIQNCIFWDNRCFTEFEDGISATYSILEKEPASELDFNLNQNPLFIDPEDGDFQLSAGSPAIGQGNLNAPLTPVDLAINVRVQQGEIDMGCYESPFAIPVSCPADINGDGQVNTADLTALLAEYGCLSNCSVDLNGDSAVNTGDLTLLLAALGNSCN